MIDLDWIQFSEIALPTVIFQNNDFDDVFKFFKVNKHRSRLVLFSISSYSSQTTIMIVIELSNKSFITIRNRFRRLNYIPLLTVIFKYLSYSSQTTKAILIKLFDKGFLYIKTSGYIDFMTFLDQGFLG